MRWFFEVALIGISSIWKWLVASVVVVGALALLRRIPFPTIPGAWRIAPYAIGTSAAFWTIQRVVASLERGAA